MISSTVDGTGSKLPISRSATAALRLSLDQRRRAIEVGRQRTMLANHQAAKQRHHAAFQKLLQSEQVCSLINSAHFRSLECQSRYYSYEAKSFLHFPPPNFHAVHLVAHIFLNEEGD